MCLAIPGQVVEIVDAANQLEEEAHATLRLLEQMGANYEQELEELKASAIE